MLASGAGCASSPGEPPTWAGGGSSCGAQLRKGSLAQGQGTQSLAQGQKSKNSEHKKISSMKGRAGVVWLVCFSGVSVKLLLATSAFAIALMAQIPVFTSFSTGQGQSLEQGQSPEQEQYDEACEKKS